MTERGQRMACDFAVAGIGIEPELPAIAGRRARTVSWPTSCAAPARLTSTPRATSRTSSTRSSAGSGSSTTTTPRSRAAPRRGPCSAPTPPTTTSIASGPTSTSTRSSTLGTHQVGPVRRPRQPRGRKLIGFYLLEGVVQAAVGLDRGGDPELDLDGEMAACARLVAARARPAPAGSPTIARPLVADPWLGRR